MVLMKNGIERNCVTEEEKMKMEIKRVGQFMLAGVGLM